MAVVMHGLVRASRYSGHCLLPVSMSNLPEFDAIYPPKRWSVAPVRYAIGHSRRLDTIHLRIGRSGVQHLCIRTSYGRTKRPLAH